MVRHEVWAYLHWTIGRAALVFGIVNLFLGIGRYRSLFTLGSWAEEALGCYLGAILIVSAHLAAEIGSIPRLATLLLSVLVCRHPWLVCVDSSLC